MRHYHALIAALALTLALTAAAPALPPPLPETHFDVTQEHGPQHVTVLRRTFPVGGSSGWHTHPGIETAYLIAGAMELHMAGQPVRRLMPGDYFMAQRGVVHNGVNIGNEPAVLMITYVTDQGMQVKIPAEAP